MQHISLENTDLYYFSFFREFQDFNNLYQPFKDSFQFFRLNDLNIEIDFDTFTKKMEGSCSFGFHLIKLDEIGKYIFINSNDNTFLGLAFIDWKGDTSSLGREVERALKVLQENKFEFKIEELA